MRETSMAEKSEGVASSGAHISILPPLYPQTPGGGEVPVYGRHPSFNVATPRSARALTRKLQGLLRKELSQGTGLDKSTTSKGCSSRSSKYEAKNWKQLSEKELRKLSDIQRSRYLAYQPPPKDIQDKQTESMKRIRVIMEAERELKQGPSEEEIIENEWNSGVVGHLKASEARYRLRRARIGHEKNKLEELAHLIVSQPSSLEAVRLKTFLEPLPPSPKTEFLSRHEHERCRTLIEDLEGKTIKRLL